MQQLFPTFNLPPPCFMLSLWNANNHLNPCVFTFPPSLKVTTRPSFSIIEVLSFFTHQKTYTRAEESQPKLNISSAVGFFSSAGFASARIVSSHPTPFNTQCRYRLACRRANSVWRLDLDFPAPFSLTVLLLEENRWKDNEFLPMRTLLIYRWIHLELNCQLDATPQKQQIKQNSFVYQSVVGISA